MNGFQYTIRLEEPVLANSLAGDANSARTLDYIPGSLIRGALISLFLGGRNTGDDLDPEFRRLFLTAATRYLHAYPVWEEKRRVLPSPLSWARAKAAHPDSDDLFDFAHAKPDEDVLKNPKPPNFSLWWPGGAHDGQEVVRFQDVSLQINVHNQRDAVRGRATEAQGAVFRYEALPAGLEMAGAILTETAEDADKLRNLCKPKSVLFIGKARTAGYGRVKLIETEELPDNWREGWKRRTTLRPLNLEDEFEEEDDEAVDWSQFEPGVKPEPVSAFVVTFLSDALVRNGCGQFSLDPMPAFRAHLGQELKSAATIFRKGEIVGGFNRKWGLPLPQVEAIAAGSVFMFETEQPVEISKLNHLEVQGIGERRNEGFGRLTVDFIPAAALRYSKHETVESPDSPDGELKDETQALLDRVLERVLRQELEEKLLGSIRNWRINSSIPGSQLSRWRVLIRNALNKPNAREQLEQVNDFVSHVQSRRRNASWQQLARARIGRGKSRRRFELWLKDLLHGDNAPWSQLGYGQEIPKIAVGDWAEKTADNALAVEFKLRLLDGVLAQRANENKRPNNTPNGGSDE